MGAVSNIYISAPYTLDNRKERIEKLQKEIFDGCTGRKMKDVKSFMISQHLAYAPYYKASLLDDAQVILILEDEAEFMTRGVGEEIDRAIKQNKTVIHLYKSSRSLYAISGIERLDPDSAPSPFTHRLLTETFLGTNSCNGELLSLIEEHHVRRQQPEKTFDWNIPEYSQKMLDRMGKTDLSKLDEISAWGQEEGLSTGKTTSISQSPKPNLKLIASSL